MASGIESKSLRKIGKKKKNILIFILLGAILLSFIMAIYNGIDMESAIKAHEAKNLKLDHPSISDESNKTANTKIAWAIDVENTLGGLKDEQERIVSDMAQETQRQITESNAIILDELARGNKVIKGKLGELRDENINLKNQLKADAVKYNSNMNAMKNEIEKNKETLLNSLEESESGGVLLPPPPLSSNFSDSDDSLFSRINIVNPVQISSGPKRTSLKEYKIISQSNKFNELNTTALAPLTKEEIIQQNTFEILTGFSSAFMITGAYAPLFGGGSSTGGSSSKSVPVLIETTGDLLMPNDSIGSIDKCFLLGIAEGNAGARAVDIRLDKMTCLVGDSQKVLQGSVEGYVVSEAGTPGLPATLIYKAGDFISRMIAAGVLEGLSTALVSAASGSDNGASGISNIYGGASSGASSGINNAFSKLSDFYLQLAEATMPILEVKAGRFISVVLIGGNKFELKDVNLLDVRDVDSYINEFVGE